MRTQIYPRVQLQQFRPATSSNCFLKARSDGVGHGLSPQWAVAPLSTAIPDSLARPRFVIHVSWVAVLSWDFTRRTKVGPSSSGVPWKSFDAWPVLNRLDMSRFWMLQQGSLTLWMPSESLPSCRHKFVGFAQVDQGWFTRVECFRSTRLVFGDRGIFVRRTAFEQLNGYRLGSQCLNSLRRRFCFHFLSAIWHGSLNVPIELATIRWCPIYPKWDI